MAVWYTTKNTFVNIPKPTESSVQRSSSVPRTFKPGNPCCCDSTRSDYDSTSASDNEVSDNFMAISSDCDSQDFPDYLTDDEGDFVCSIAGASLGANNKITLCLADMAGKEPLDSSNSNKVKLSLDDTVNAESRTKLRSQAQPFKSATTPPAEVTAVMKAASEVLSSGSDISEVQVHEGGMGGTTMIVGKSASADPDARVILALVKDTLLNLAESSENTYILGYGAQPFNNLDALSFSATLACVPLAHEGTTCWDTYEQGRCPRLSTCCWNHPSETDKMRIIIMIQKAA